MAALFNTQVSRTLIEDKLKKFDNIITVAKTGYGDFVCSDAAYTSDTQCINAALSAAVDGQTIIFLDGEYDIDTTIYSTGKSFSWIGNGKVTINLSGGSADSAVLRFSGNSVRVTTLYENAAMYSLTVTLLSVDGVQAGDLINIYNTDQWSPTEYPLQKTGEMYEIVAVDAGTKIVTLSQPLYRAYLLANTTVKIYTPANINLKNINFSGIGKEAAAIALTLLYGSHSTIENCSFLNFGKRAVSLATCYDILISNNNIRGCAYPGYGYGVSVSNASTYIKIHGNEITDCRHAITGTTGGVMFEGLSVGAFEGLNRCITITDNLLVGANMLTSFGNTIDSHPCTIDYTVTGNKIYPSVHLNAPYNATYAFGDGTQISIFSGNEIYGGGGVMRRPGAPSSNLIMTGNIIENTRGTGLYNGNYYDNHPGCPVYLKIHDNIVKNATKISGMTEDGDPGIYIGTEDYRSVSIVGNTIDGCTLDALRINLHTAIITDNMKLIVGNNIFNNTGWDGIYIRRDNSDLKLDAIIQNNTISEVNQTNTIFRGIALIDVSGARVEGNHMTNRGSIAAVAAIKEVSTVGAVNYNAINNNTYYGATGGVVIVGANSEATGNKLITS